MLPQRPGRLDGRPQRVVLRVDDHHAVFDPEVRRPEDLRAGGRRDAHGELRAQRRDLRRLRQLDQLSGGGIERLFVTQHPLQARVGVGQAATNDVDGHGQHGADGAGEEEPAGRRAQEVGRIGPRDGQDGEQDEPDRHHRFPGLAVEGDAHHRHEQQDAESAPDAAGRQHEIRHRRHVEGRADHEGPGWHAPAGQEQDQDQHQQGAAGHVGPSIDGPGWPGHAELPHHATAMKGR